MKSFRTHEELAAILTDRGLAIGDPTSALRELRRHGYHRLGGYRYPFRQLLPAGEQNAASRSYRDDKYVPGASFEDVLTLAEFDAKLRRVCLEGLLEFEVRLRSALAHRLAAIHPMAHVTKGCLDEAVCDERTASDLTKLESWLNTVRESQRRAVQADDDYVSHHFVEHPATDVPVWALVELVDFGSLPFLMDLMRASDLNSVAREFGTNNGKTLVTWTRAQVDLRNVAAHSLRLFNRRMKRRIVIRSGSGAGPQLDHLVEHPKNLTDRAYSVLAVLAYVLKSHESGTNWHLTLRTQIRKFPDCAGPVPSEYQLSPSASMGFPSEWDTLDLWCE